MSQEVPRDRALTEQEREYLHSRGQHDRVAMQDAAYPQEDPEEDSEEADAPYTEWTKAELQAECETRGLSKSGTVAELAQRLEENDASKQA